MSNQFGLLGGKLGHSLSPKIHQLFFAYTGKEGSYGLLETPLEELPQRMASLQGNYVGCNVTIPHKLHVIPFLSSISPEAAAIGAVNTLKFMTNAAGETTIEGHNTDYFGFGRMLEYNNLPVCGAKAAVLGSGGAARAVVKYLADQGAAQVLLVSRDPAKIDPELVALAPDCLTMDYAQLEKEAGDLLINCTPVGMYPKVEVSPVSAEVSAKWGASVDLIYNPAETLFLKQAKEAGKPAVNGLFMLVAQAVAAQEIWQGESYSSELISKIMQELEQSI